MIPEEITHIKGLEVLDVGYNNFSGKLPGSLGNNFSMTLLYVGLNRSMLDSFGRTRFSVSDELKSCCDAVCSTIMSVLVT